MKLYRRNFRHKDSDTEDGMEPPSKHPTLAESLTSSERSHTPSSSAAGTPPASAEAPPLLGSPSSVTSSSLSTNGRPFDSFLSQSAFISATFYTEFLQLESSQRRQKLNQICLDLQRVLAEQEACKCRVEAAQDPMELTRIQQELNRLSQRQMELTDQQAICLAFERQLAPPPPSMRTRSLSDEKIKETSSGHSQGQSSS